MVSQSLAFNRELENIRGCGMALRYRPIDFRWCMIQFLVECIIIYVTSCWLLKICIMNLK